jgi:hypothetical protein
MCKHAQSIYVRELLMYNESIRGCLYAQSINKQQPKEEVLYECE